MLPWHGGGQYFWSGTLVRGRGVVKVQDAGVGWRRQGVLESYICREGPWEFWSGSLVRGGEFYIGREGTRSSGVVHWYGAGSSG